MKRAFDGHFSRMFSGYLLAVLVAASSITAMGLIGVMVEQIARARPLFEVILGLPIALPVMLLFSFLIVFFAALPVWIVVAVYAEWRSVRSLAAHFIFGAIAPFPPYLMVMLWSANPKLALPNLIRGDNLTSTLLLLMIGCAGGWIYWRFVGHRAGAWREVDESMGTGPK